MLADRAVSAIQTWLIESGGGVGTTAQLNSLTWTTERRAGGLLVVSFYGRVGLGSDGNAHGHQMQEAIREALTSGATSALIIDLSLLEYRFGDWIGAVPLQAVKQLGIGRVCLVAAGETATALRALWESSRMGRVVPLVAGLEAAEQQLSGHKQK